MSSDIKRYRNNLRDELNGAAIYAASAEAETNPLRKVLLLQLPQARSKHAHVGCEKVATAGIADERFVPVFRTRLLAKQAKRFGPGFVIPSVAAAEYVELNKYAGQVDAHAISA